MKIFLALFACFALGLASCSYDDHATSQPMAQAMNTTCPISGEPIDASKTATFHGQTIAFCCGRCQAKWESMSEAEKEAAIQNLK